MLQSAPSRAVIEHHMMAARDARSAAILGLYRRFLSWFRLPAWRRRVVAD